MKRLIEEIRHRSLWVVLGIYLAASGVILRVIMALENSLALPPWVLIVALVLLSMGLPIILSTAFVQGVSSAVHRTPEDPSARATGDPATIRRVFTWRNALVGGVGGFAALAVGTITWILAGVGKPLPRSEVQAAEAAEPRREVVQTPAEDQAADAFRPLALAIRAMDVEGTLAAYDDAAEFTYAFDSNLIEGRERFDATVRSGFAALRSIEVWEIDELQATRLDDEHVLVVARFHEVAVDTAGVRTSVEGVVTNVFVRRGDAWRVAHGHAAASVDGAP